MNQFHLDMCKDHDLSTLQCLHPFLDITSKSHDGGYRGCQTCIGGKHWEVGRWVSKFTCLCKGMGRSMHVAICNVFRDQWFVIDDIQTQWDPHWTHLKDKFESWLPAPHPIIYLFNNCVWFFLHCQSFFFFFQVIDASAKVCLETCMNLIGSGNKLVDLVGQT